MNTRFHGINNSRNSNNLESKGTQIKQHKQNINKTRLDAFIVKYTAERKSIFTHIGNSFQ